MDWKLNSNLSSDLRFARVQNAWRRRKDSPCLSQQPPFLFRTTIKTVTSRINQPCNHTGLRISQTGLMPPTMPHLESVTAVPARHSYPNLFVNGDVKDHKATQGRGPRNLLFRLPAMMLVPVNALPRHTSAGDSFGTT